MLCDTIKKGVECAFMTKKGCSFQGGHCNPVIEKCEGCAKIVHYETGNYCSVYPDPTSKWRNGRCPGATHIKIEMQGPQEKINPLKASKRANKK
jgi:hypothetical protein